MVTEWFPRYDTATIMLVDLANYVRSTTWTLTPNSSKYAPASKIQLNLTQTVKQASASTSFRARNVYSNTPAKQNKKLETDIMDTEVTSEAVRKQLLCFTTSRTFIL